MVHGPVGYRHIYSHNWGHGQTGLPVVTALIQSLRVLGRRRNWAGDEQGLIAKYFSVTLTLTNSLFPLKDPCSSPTQFRRFPCIDCTLSLGGCKKLGALPKREVRLVWRITRIGKDEWDSVTMVAGGKKSSALLDSLHDSRYLVVL